MTTVFRRAPLAAILLAAPALAAGGFQDLDALEIQTVATLGAGIGEPGGPARPIDRRLKLAACPGMVSIDPGQLGAATLRCEALGWRIRVPLVRDTQATVMMAAKSEPVIRRGDQVELVALAGSFQVSTLATAEQDGAPGDRIRLRTDRKTAVSGQVLADGRVALPGFK